jgi:drug/metabolite transporter (DMT)-like permease
MLMAGVRFLMAGGLLLLIVKLRGVPWPSRRKTINAMLIGMLLLAGGVGSVTFAEQWVTSGLAAVAVATVPLWTLLLSLFWGERPAPLDWVALLIGLGGIVLLNLEETMLASPIGAIALLVAPISWALGSNLSKHRQLPDGAMGFALELLGGAVLLLVLGPLRGERWPAAISLDSTLALFYLALFGSLIAFSAYMYAVSKVRLALATSYAYVNPVVALVLGAVVADEPLTPLGIVATLVILGSVVVLTLAQSKRSMSTAATAADH